jgi:hypothetical protein
MNIELIRDALESIKLTPTSPLLWQRISALIIALEGRERPELIADVASMSFESQDATWLKYSALAYLTRNPDWLIQQAALADSNTAPDAIMTLLTLVWYHALARTAGPASFEQLLRDIDAPRLQRLVTDHLPASKTTRRVGGSPLRVAIYTPQVTSSRHGGTTFTINIMSVLARQGYDLQTFTAQETTIPLGVSYCGGRDYVAQVPVEAETLSLHVSANVQVILPSADFSLRWRFGQMLTAIHDYAPDVVVFVGFMSPLVYRLYEHYPVLGLSIHAIQPLAPVDVYLSSDAQADAKQWSDLPTPRVAHYPFRFWPKGKAVPINRTSIELPESAVVLGTAGYRLDVEITPQWYAPMLAFIENHSEAHWLLIGIAEGQVLAGLPIHPRIYRLAPQLNLEVWLATCDIYVAPPRVGGGGCVAMAMEQGLPVVAFAGTDGGDKVGPLAVSTIDACTDRLSAWVKDGEARREVGEALRVQFHDRLDISSQQAQTGLIRACHSAIESFIQRTEKNNG